MKLKPIIVATIFLATACYAQTIRNGRELTARVWPDGTELTLVSADRVMYCDKPILAAGHLTIHGEHKTLINRQYRNGAPLFSTSDSARLTLYNLDLLSLEFIGGMNRAMLVDGRGATLRNVTVGGGDTIILRRGNLTWIGGGTGKTTPRKYGALYAGDVLNGDTQSTFWLQNLGIRSGRDETGLRIMGSSGTIQNCTFDGRTNTRFKESAQVRHGNDRDEPIRFISCSFINSQVNGPLGQGGAEAANLRKYHDYAVKHPARIIFDGGEMDGYSTCEGMVRVEYKGFNFARRDTWNKAPSYAVGARTQWMGYGTFRPIVSLKGCVKGEAWKLIAGPGISVTP